MALPTAFTESLALRHPIALAPMGGAAGGALAAAVSNGGGRGVAAALVLGAAGALVGTRFQTCPEALAPPHVVQALLDGRGGDTERSDGAERALASAGNS